MPKLLVACLVAVLSIGCGSDSPTSGQNGTPQKTLVVYCSVTGNTEAAAAAIAQTLGADIEKLRVNDTQPVTAARLYAMSGSGIDLASVRWSIMPLSNDLSRYSRVILGGPVWYGNPSSVLTSFIDSANLSGKSAVVFLTMGQPDDQAALRTLSARATARSATVVSSFTLSAGTLGSKEAIAQRAREIAATLKP